MKKYFLSLTIALTLLADNPSSYSALGDVLYDDIAKFDKLKEMASMQASRAAIDTYNAKAAKTKEMGFALDAKDASVNGKVYLKALRELSTEHDAIILESRKRFKEAISDEDGVTINDLIRYGAIDQDDYKNELIAYYEEFGEDQNLSALDEMYTKHLESLKGDTGTAVSEAQRERLENEARVKRMRAKEKEKQDTLEQSVLAEKNKEKKKVLSEQKKALGIQ